MAIRRFLRHAALLILLGLLAGAMPARAITPSSTAVSSSANPSAFGQTVVFTAVVTGNVAKEPTGTVQFTIDGVNFVPVAPLVADAPSVGNPRTARASISISSLSVGTHPVSAQYSGDFFFDPSAGTLAPAQTVTAAATTTALISSANPSAFGQAVTFTAQVAVTAPGVGPRTGTVDFKDGGVVLGTVSVNAGGQAAFTTSALTAGPHTITAVFNSANANVTGSASSAVAQVVNRAVTTTALASSANPSTTGQSITFTAQVSVTAPGAGAPTGGVQFNVDTVDVGGPVALSGGTATFSTSTLPAGTHLVRATFVGDGNFAPSSAAVSQLVKAATTTTLTSSLNPSAFGQAVTFTAQVSVPSATGNVTFKDGATTIGSGTLGDGGTAGQTSVTTSSLAAGTHTITAIYTGDSNNAGSTSSPVSQVVNPAASTTALTSSANPSAFGQAVTFTATVTGTAGPPTGTVDFKDGGGVLGTVSVNGGQAAFTTSALAVGAHTITAEFTSASANNAGSASAALTQTVGKAATTTALTSSANPSAFGQAVTFTAQVAVTAPGVGTPTGTVSFRDGGAVLGTVSVNGGQAAFTTSALAVGAHTITAEFTSASANNAGSASAALTQTVGKAASTTALTSSANPSAFGQAVTFTATVTGTAGTPTGTVSFRDGGAVLGSGAVNGSGQVMFTTAALAVGTHTITAEYAGDPNLAPSTGAMTQVVSKAATATGLTSSLNPSTFGQSVTFTAAVSVTAPGAGTPTGSVTFFNGSTVIGTSNLVGSGATFTSSTLPLGPNQQMTAVYNGDASFSTSASAAVLQTVGQAANTVVVASQANPSKFGQPVTLVASVTGGSAGVPTGTVNFLDGATVIGSGALDNTGRASLVVSSLAAGAHPITASYLGDTNNAARASAPLTQVVQPAGTAIALASSRNPSVVGLAVDFTATVSAVAPGAGAPTGRVQFQADGANVKADGTPGDDPITLNGNGEARFSTASLAVGPHQITANYLGDANFAPTNNVLAQTVNNGTPTIVRLTPNSVLQNDPSFPLAIEGSGFAPAGVRVLFNGVPFDAVTSGSGTLVTANIPGSGQPNNQIVLSGTVLVSVQNPSQPVASNTLPFQIKSPNGPKLFTINPVGVLAGLIPNNASLIVTLRGSNFAPDAFVSYRQQSGNTPFFNAANSGLRVSPDGTQVTFALPGSLLQSPDTATVNVRNPDPAGDILSDSLAFTVGENPIPLLTSLEPAGKPVGGDPGTTNFLLKVNGVNFLPGALLTFTGPAGNAMTFGPDRVALSPTGDQAAVTLDNGLIPLAGNYGVQVTNVRSIDRSTNPPSPSYLGALPSAPKFFSVQNRKPIVNAFSPPVVVAGATQEPNTFRLTLTGSNFDPGVAGGLHSTVVFNNTTLPQGSVAVASTTQLTASVPASLVGAAGLASVTVVNLDSSGAQVASDPARFPINPIYARGTFPSKGIVMFSTPYDYTGSSPFDILKEVTFSPGLAPGQQYFGGASSGLLTDLQDLLGLNAQPARIAQWQPQIDAKTQQPVGYLYAPAPPALGLQLQLGRAYWGVGFPDRNGDRPGAFGVIRLGAPATVNPYPVPLARGWNMVGDPFPGSLSISTINVQRAGRVFSFTEAVNNGFISPVFWSFEGAAGYVAHFPGSVDRNRPAQDTLDPFAGYWLLSYTDCQLLVPRP